MNSGEKMSCSRNTPPIGIVWFEPTPPSPPPPKIPLKPSRNSSLGSNFPNFPSPPWIPVTCVAYGYFLDTHNTSKKVKVLTEMSNKNHKTSDFRLTKKLTIWIKRNLFFSRGPFANSVIEYTLVKQTSSNKK